MAMKILSVDLQNDFTAEGGAHFRPRPCVPFLRETFLPFVHRRGYTIAEIISDYRATDPGDGPSVCVPGTWGYQSLIPADVKHPSVWIKAVPSPAWIREGAGQVERLPGVPYPAPEAFSAWLAATIGPPTPDDEIVLVGLMLEVCVLSTLQELRYRGYPVKVLFEGVDTNSGDVEQKRLLFETLFPFWGQAVYWHDLETSKRFSLRYR